MQKLILKVKSNQVIADKIYQLVITGVDSSFKFNLEDFKPGKFLHIKCGDGLDPLLRRPMSICNITDDGSEMTVLYRKEGKGTTELSQFVPGQTIDILAPLGSHFPTEGVLKRGEAALMIGGGIGVPPLYYLARKLSQQGIKIYSILGFNSKKDVFYEDAFAALGATTITTVDGSYGTKGFVTDALKAQQSWDALYSCGPSAMLKALQGIIPEDKRAFISMEERMGCGVGACLACVCKVNPDFTQAQSTVEAHMQNKDYRRICSEGPVFKMHEILI